MRILILSDTHSRIRDVFSSWSLEDRENALSCDLLIHGGDLTSYGHLSELESELSWINNNFHMDKVIISGNHDFYLDTNWSAHTPQGKRRFSSNGLGSSQDIDVLMLKHNMIYLNDSSYVKNGVRIWGSPVTPWFHDWAFNRQRGYDIQKHWDMIPNDTDILVTHGPPRGILDLLTPSRYRDLSESPNVGCDHLLSKVVEIKPKVHIFGHIHEGRGMIEKSGTVFINASCLDVNYEPINNPIIFTYESII